MDIVEKARRFAQSAHRAVNHRRKYTDEPYEVHLADVAAMVESVPHTAAMVAAAWLHDTVEDTTVGLDDIRREFGDEVCKLVENLTDVSRPEDGNRAQRKVIDREHLARASPMAKTVKLADVLSNVPDITAHARGFARIYVREAEALLEVLREGDPGLWARAREAIAAARKELGMPQR